MTLIEVRPPDPSAGTEVYSVYTVPDDSVASVVAVVYNVVLEVGIHSSRRAMHELYDEDGNRFGAFLPVEDSSGSGTLFDDPSNAQTWHISSWEQLGLGLITSNFPNITEPNNWYLQDSYLPEVLLPPGWEFKLHLARVQPGDEYQNIRLLVDELRSSDVEPVLVTAPDPGPAVDNVIVYTVPEGKAAAVRGATFNVFIRSTGHPQRIACVEFYNDADELMMRHSQDSQPASSTEPNIRYSFFRGADDISLWTVIPFRYRERVLSEFFVPEGWKIGVRILSMWTGATPDELSDVKLLLNLVEAEFSEEVGP